MLGSQSIVGFIPTKDFRRAKTFYGDTLGLRVVSEDQFAVAFESAATMIRVVKVGDFTPVKFTTLGWQVDDIDETAAALQKRGGVFERFPGMEQDEQGIWRAPGGARVAWFKDPDGNVLSISFHG